MPDATAGNPSAHQLAVREAAARLAREQRHRLISLAARLGVPPDLREDAVQQGLFAFLRSFPGDPTDRTGTFSYLARCVQTASWRILAKRRADEAARHAVSAAAAHDVLLERLVAEQAQDTLDQVIIREANSQALELVAQLPRDQRHVLVLNAIGLSPQEIADETGLNRRQVRRRVEKANRRLQKLQDTDGPRA